VYGRNGRRAGCNPTQTGFARW